MEIGEKEEEEKERVVSFNSRNRQRRSELKV